MNESILSTTDPELRARVPRGTPLIVALGGLNDAGGVVSQLTEYLWERCNPQEFVQFNNDLLLDYRSRRPLLTFDVDHFEDYSPETLSLSLAHDELGTPFLILSGYEPDFRWEQFIDQVLMLVDEFEVSMTVWSHSIPMPVPHTRPIRATVSGSRDDLIESRSVWKPTTKLPASVTHVLEYRLYSLGEEVTGYALLVPHYLANNEFPDALLAALDGFMAATGLLFATDDVRSNSESFHRQVQQQIADSHESEEMLQGLEERYDSYMEDEAGALSTDIGVRNSPLMDADGSIPTADQLASELERFLAQQRDSGQGDSPQQ